MQKQHSFIALYDANPEHAHFESPFLMNRARALARALSASHSSLITRISSPAISAVLSSLDSHTSLVVLSPASNREEHSHAFRLPATSYPTIFTGKGAVGSDKMALSSASAVLIMGSHSERLENILDYAVGHNIPIAILSEESALEVHKRIHDKYSNSIKTIFISDDAEVLVRQISEEIRRQSFSNLH